MSWNQLVYNLKLTLTCPNCGKDCPFPNPFVPPTPPEGFTGRAWDSIREASLAHKIEGCSK